MGVRNSVSSSVLARAERLSRRNHELVRGTRTEARNLPPGHRNRFLFFIEITISFTQGRVSPALL